MTVETGRRVPRNTHAPLTLLGVLSTAGHCDQSRNGMLLYSFASFIVALPCSGHLGSDADGHTMNGPHYRHFGKTEHLCKLDARGRCWFSMPRAPGGDRRGTGCSSALDSQQGVQGRTATTRMSPHGRPHQQRGDPPKEEVSVPRVTEASSTAREGKRRPSSSTHHPPIKRKGGRRNGRLPAAASQCYR
jgi:hypothetical protein